jgi:class 3 adenylate cyclase/tetratricopeptide (TPR) repeat protein
MPYSLQTQLEQLYHSMAVLEAQRALLGDAVVEPALAGLRQQVAALQTQPAADLTPVEERRILTILFADVVGSTALAEKQDPEEWRQIIAQIHATVGDIIANHNGAVVQYLGDGLLAFFGAKQAGERDPENAIRAALESQGALAKLETREKIKVRVGIHTGLVVIGELGAAAHKEYTATGDAMNLAARLQSAAPPGGILISHDTYRHVRGVFDVTPQPPLTVKGKSEPLQTFLVRRAKPRVFRVISRGVAGVETRTVGREAEIQRLRGAYLDAFSQHKVVWAQIIGEAGVGKSRLVDDTNEWLDLREESFRLFRARAIAGEVTQPFALIRRMWFDRFQIAEDAPLAQAEAKWVKGFQELSRTAEIEPAHALGLLVGLPFNDSPYIGALRADPAQVKGRAFVVSRELFKTVREQDPTVILLEDLHWADGSSWEYLKEVVLEGDSPGARNGLFIAATARPEWNPPDTLKQYSQYIQLDLAPLSEDDTRELAHELLKEVEAVPKQVVEMLIERSEGVPYYAEELVNWFIDRGIVDQSSEPWRFVSSRLQESPLPTTLQHLLLTRLSLLSENERAGLQRGAILGRNFWEGGIAALGVRQPNAILNGLQPRGFVEPQSESSLEGEKEWSFRHVLLRDATYESVLKRERAGLHKAAANWLEEQARRAGRLDEFAGLLGEHAERSGEKSAAADWYLRAGERAKAQGAMREAESFCSRVLELLPPSDKERRWQALLGREEVLAILGEQEAYQADVNALVALAREMADDRRLGEALMRQSIYLHRMGAYRAQLSAVEETLAAAQRGGDQLLEVRALADKAEVLTRLGEMEGALAGAEDALARARELKDYATLLQVLINAAFTHGYSGDWGRIVAAYSEAAELAHRLGDRYREGLVLSDLGYTYTQLGLYKQARVRLEQARSLNEAIGSRRPRAYSLQNLGLVYWRSGDRRLARAVLDESARELEALGDALGRATGLLYLAYEMEDSGDMARASQRYMEARDLFTNLGGQGLAHDARAGLARCALKRGQLDQAREQATELAIYLRDHGSAGMDAPIWAYQTCADVFDALVGLSIPSSANSESGQVAVPATSGGNDVRTLGREAVDAGYRELMERADKITNVEWRKSFLENVS